MTRLILASVSPRRSILLRQIVPEFDVIPSHAEELEDHARPADEIAQLNAAAKAEAIAREHPDAIVLGADTVVALGNRLFGKPKHLAEAEEFLSELAGKTHRVITGVCLIHRRAGLRSLFSEATEVTFRDLTRDEIVRYLHSIDPLDKAGAYAIQEGGERIVARIAGSRTNVVGLPTERLRVELAGWGIAVEQREPD